MNRLVSISPIKFGAVIFAMLGAAIYAAQSGGSTGSSTQWPAAGNDLSNSRNQPTETVIGKANAGSLATKWIFHTGGDVSATPTVGANAIYVPDWKGNLYAINKASGQAMWSAQISQYDGVAGAISRVSPAIHGADIIIGDIGSMGTPHDGARIMAINQQNGALHWVTQVEKNQAAIITGSPVVVGDMVVVGVASNE